MSLGGSFSSKQRPTQFPILLFIFHPLSMHTILISLVSPSTTHSALLPYPHLCPEYRLSRNCGSEPQVLGTSTFPPWGEKDQGMRETEPIIPFSPNRANPPRITLQGPGKADRILGEACCLIEVSGTSILHLFPQMCYRIAFQPVASSHLKREIQLDLV